MALERLTIKPPPGFDWDTQVSLLPALASKRTGNPGWVVDSIDPEKREAHLSRTVEASATSRGESGPDAIKIPLLPGTKVSDGDRVAARQAELHPGYHMVRFDPHLGTAVLARLSADELRCRAAVATGLGVKPWDVLCSSRKDGGFSLSLPNQYQPSRHDAKLQEVAESVVGRFGWYVDIDAKRLLAQIIPSEPPTFPEMLRLDLSSLGAADIHLSPFGFKLPPPGKDATEPACIDWKAQAWALLGGLPGAGKSVLLNNLLAHQVSHGAELVILDDPSKSVDFLWAKSFVRDGGWGCDGLRSAITSLALVYEEGQRRAEQMKTWGYNNWLDLPADKALKPIFVVVDEVSALLVTERLPAGVDRKLPEVQEIIEENRLRFKLQRLIFKTVAEMRFVGIRMILSTQVTNTNTGLPPTMKALLGQKILAGTNPSKTQRAQAFNVETNVPSVPENLRGGGKVAKGVGAAELEAQAPFVYKAFFATTDELAQRLVELGCPQTAQPEPTQAQMARLCPENEGEDIADPVEPLTFGGVELTPSGKPVSSLDPKFGPRPAAYGTDGKRLTGAAAAAHGSKQTVEVGPPCPSCDQPIRPDGACGCSW